MPNVMVALPNIGGALCSTPQSSRRETRWNLQGCLKVLDRSQPLVGRKFTILCEHVEDILLLNKFFPIVDTCLSCKDIARQSCAMVPRWRFLATFLYPVFSASHVQQVSDLHLKFALRPHRVWKYGKRRLRLGEEKKRKKKKKEETTGWKYNGLAYYIGWP